MQYPQGICYPTLIGDKERDWHEISGGAEGRERASSLCTSPDKSSRMVGESMTVGSPVEAYTPDIELLPCVCFPGQLCYDSCALREKGGAPANRKPSLSRHSTCPSRELKTSGLGTVAGGQVKVVMGPSGPMFVRVNEVEAKKSVCGGTANHKKEKARTPRGRESRVSSFSNDGADASADAQEGGDDATCNARGGQKVRSLTEAVMCLSLDLGFESEVT